MGGGSCHPTTELVDGVMRMRWPGDMCLEETTDLQREPVEGGIRVRLLAITPEANLPGDRAWFDRVWTRVE